MFFFTNTYWKKIYFCRYTEEQGQTVYRKGVIYIGDLQTYRKQSEKENKRERERGKESERQRQKERERERE